ncbi:hypothetical protein ACFTY8_40855 [Streptomyces mirabilis]|uniref:hypothetical protein n=1 Tax=Streptomyces mirabilis TaxID=68239 RepID=UPI00362AEB17
MITASAGAADRDQGLVGGVINTSRQLRAAIGAALLPAVADAVDRTRHASTAVGDRGGHARRAGGGRPCHAGGDERLASIAPRRRRAMRTTSMICSRPGTGPGAGKRPLIRSS